MSCLKFTVDVSRHKLSSQPTDGQPAQGLALKPGSRREKKRERERETERERESEKGWPVRAFVELALDRSKL